LAERSLRSRLNGKEIVFMPKPIVAVLAWLPEGVLPRWIAEFSGIEFRDARESGDVDRCLADASIAYGLPPVARLGEASQLRWIQLISAGVPYDLCSPARERGLTVTNLAGLYGPSIAEHAFALLVTLARNLHVAFRNQAERRWDRTVADTMTDLQGHTLAIIGLGNIGQSIARLGRGYGTCVVGCRRTDRPASFVDRVYPRSKLAAMLSEADYLAIAAPQTPHTEGMLGPAEFAALKPGCIYVNVSRGGIAQEPALLAALESGRVRAAGLDVFAVEPLAPDHPFWRMPNVLVSPHYSGETINTSSRPAERFARNLRNWLSSAPLEGVVDLHWGY
jgi:phosphoglycerate dehydrogenase-like enzyme